MNDPTLNGSDCATHRLPMPCQECAAERSATHQIRALMNGSAAMTPKLAAAMSKGRVK